MNRSVPWLGIMCTLLGSTSILADERSIQLRDAPGRDVTMAHCAMCHSLDYIEMNASVLDASGWAKSVRKMIGSFGAPIDDESARRITEYLAANY